DILWRHLVTGDMAVWFMNGVSLVTGTFTTPSALADLGWQVAATADFNRDGHPDIFWRHASSGENAIWYMNGTVLTGGTLLTPAAVDTSWTMAGAADFNRDGHTDLLWHHPA